MAFTDWRLPTTLLNDSSSGGASAWGNIDRLKAKDGSGADGGYLNQDSFLILSKLRTVKAGIIQSAELASNQAMDVGTQTFPTIEFRDNTIHLTQAAITSLLSGDVNLATFGIAVAVGRQGHPIGGDPGTPAATTTNYAKATGFGFSLPSGSVILSADIRLPFGQDYAGPGLNFLYMDSIEMRLEYEVPIIPGGIPIAGVADAGSSALSGVVRPPFPNGFKYRRKLVIDHTKVYGGADMIEFPLFLKLTSPELRAMSSGGNVVNGTFKDFRVETDTGTKLSHQVDYYDPSAGTISLWAKLPILSGTVDQTLYLYYGATLAATEESVNTWPAPYKAVYHLSDAPTNTPGGIKDATPNARHLNVVGGMTSAQWSINSLGTAYDFDGVDDRLIYPANLVDFHPAMPMTVSAIVRPDAFTTSMWIMGEQPNWALRIDNTAGTISLNLVKGSVIDQRFNYPMTAGTTYWITAVQTATKVEYYVNGTLVGSFTNSQAYQQNNGNFTIGADPTGAQQFNGIIDEVRKVHAALSANWIATEYYNQIVPPLFYRVTGQEGAPVRYFSAATSGDAEIERASVAVDQKIAGATSGGSDATAKIQFPNLRARIIGDSDASATMLIRPFYTQPAAGDSAATMNLIHTKVAQAYVDGDAVAVVDMEHYSPDLQKVYRYDIFSPSGQYITTWRDEVNSAFQLNEEINSPGSELSIDLARTARDFGQGNDVAYMNEVVVTVSDREVPNGRIVYRGFISDFEPSYSEDIVQISVQPYGMLADGTIMEGGESIGKQQSSASGIGTIFDSNEVYPVRLHQVRMGGTAVRASAIMYRLRAVNDPSMYNFVRVGIYNTFNEARDGTNPLAVADVGITSQEFQDYRFNFANRPLLTANTDYFIGIRPTRPYGSAQSTTFQIMESTTDVYPTDYFFTPYYAEGSGTYRFNETGTDPVFTLFSSTGSTTINLNSQDPGQMLRDALDDQAARGGRIRWTEESLELTGTVASYDGNTTTLLDFVRAVLKRSPTGWYWYIDPATNLFHFHQFSDQADQIFYIGRNIKKPQMAFIGSNVQNVVYFSGGKIGVDSNGKDINFYKKYSRQASVDLFGERAVRLSDENVTQAATADIIANRYLDVYAPPEVVFTGEVIDSNGNEQGIDLEQVVVGQQIMIGNAGLAATTQFDVALFDQDPFDYDANSTPSLTIPLTKLTRKKDTITFSLSTKAQALLDIDKRIEEIRRNVEALQNSDNPASPTA